MYLKCFVFPDWTPRMAAAGVRRGWMDEAPDSYPYRCLPLAIANGHGWEILSPCGFEVEWNGDMSLAGVTITTDPGTPQTDAPVSIFGQAIVTLHTQGILRTPPGWNIWVSGPPNHFKDGVQPLTGVIETDWSPFTFTMNWKLTRPGLRVRFEKNEPIAHFFPVQRGMVEQFQPEVVPIESDPDLLQEFKTLSASRVAFSEKLKKNPPARPSDQWQKFYHRGMTASGACPVTDHQTKLRVPDFPGQAERKGPIPETKPVAAPQTPAAGSPRALSKSEWVLENQARQRALSEAASGIFRAANLTPQYFLDQCYAPGRPVVIADLARRWPAFERWTPAYLRQLLGDTPVDCQVGGDKEGHIRSLPFGAFIDLAEAQPANVISVASSSSARNNEALAPLRADLGEAPGILSSGTAPGAAMFWIGPGGAVTPLHHDLTNSLLVQITGRKQVVLAPPSETPKLYNDVHAFGEIQNLLAKNHGFDRHPRLRDVRLHTLNLEPGDALFIPAGWWRQVRSLNFGVSATYTNFMWPNESWAPPPN